MRHFLEEASNRVASIQGMKKKREQKKEGEDLKAGTHRATYSPTSEHIRHYAKDKDEATKAHLSKLADDLDDVNNRLKNGEWGQAGTAGSDIHYALEMYSKIKTKDNPEGVSPYTPHRTRGGSNGPQDLSKRDEARDRSHNANRDSEFANRTRYNR